MDGRMLMGPLALVLLEDQGAEPVAAAAGLRRKQWALDLEQSFSVHHSVTTGIYFLVVRIRQWPAIREPKKNYCKLCILQKCVT